MKNKFSKRKIVLLSSISLLTLIGIILLIIFALTPTANAVTFNPEYGKWESDKNTFNPDDVELGNYISITELCDNGNTPTNDKIITISSSDELDLLSEKCDPQKNSQTSAELFLAGHYLLLCDITYTSFARNFVPIGYDLPFTGVFDGNGFEILNLSFIDLTSTNTNSKKYWNINENSNGIKYFAMFSKNEGIVENFGLVSPKITINYVPDNISYIAPVVGLNEGTVKYVYHKMLESRNENSNGINSQGGFFISGFASINNNNISNVYNAVSILSQTASTEIIQQAEIANENTGTINNAYFYDSTIAKYDNENGINITYDHNYVKEYLDLKNSKHVGTYCSSLDDLSTGLAVNKSDKKNTEFQFYSLNSYSDGVRNLFKNENGKFIYETPILKGIVGDSIQDSKVIFTISNEKEFSYMFELFNKDVSFVGSDLTYEINSDINMSLIKVNSCKANIAATIKGSGSSNKTIYNVPIGTYYTTEFGYDCYGLFPHFSGIISNINVVIGKSKTYSIDVVESNNKKAIGSIVGYLNGGIVQNCNVYADININDNIGEFSIGGAVGVMVSTSATTAEISNVVVNGKIEQVHSKNNGSYSFSKIGGVVGYITESTGIVSDVLSTIDIVSAGNENSDDLAIGGAVGAGYLSEFNKIQFGKASKGVIVISGYFSHASGLIGRLLGVSNQVNELTNYGDITVNCQSNKISYLAGLMNVDIIKADSSLPTTKKALKNNGEYLFYASKLNNNSYISVKGKNPNLQFTYGLNIQPSNQFTSYISGLYNGVSDTKEIILNNISNFAPLINSICNGDTSYKVNLYTVYNYSNFKFTTNDTISNHILVSGVANGKNINFNDVRNNGGLTFELGNTTTNSPNLIVNGVFEELSLGTTANKIYNGGNIVIKDISNSTQTGTSTGTSSVDTIDINIYASGICYKNLAVLSDDTQNPLKAAYDNTLVGSLNNVINNGFINVTSDFWTDRNKDMTVYAQSNNNNTENAKQNSLTRLNGDVYTAGISYLNEGVISNAFNLGDIKLDVYSRNDTSRYVVGGIATYFNGQYAQIRDSANNGTLQVVNMSNIKKGYIHIGGILALNNYGYKGTTLNSIDSIIAFSINYGTLIGFNGTENIPRNSTLGNFSCMVGGILSFGSANIVNVVNYGNIYGTEVVSSIIACFDMSVYNKTEFNLANTINYGTVSLLEKYHYSGATLYNISFKDVDNISYPDSSLKYTTNGLYDASGSQKNYYYLGAMFGVVNFSSNNNAIPRIRYVINFINAPIVQTDNQINSTNVNVDTTTFITVNGSTDVFGNNSIKYAPLSSVSDSAGNIGVFASNFIFRKAINKDSSAVDFVKYLTDNYISDFFDFVRFDKINTVLLDKIGWRTIAYINAAESLAKNLELMSKFVSNSNTEKVEENTKDCFNSTTWMDNIDSKLLNDFILEAINSNNSELTGSYETIVRKIIFDKDGNYKSSIATSIRKEIISNIMNFYENDEENKANYKQVLQNLLYDELLAKIISGESTDYTAVQNEICKLLNVKDSDLRTVMTNYLEALVNGNITIDKIFDDDPNNYYLEKKIELITNLLSGYSDDAIKEMVKDLIPDSVTSDENLVFYNYLNEHKDIASQVYVILVKTNNSESEEYLNALNTAFKKYDIETFASKLTSGSLTNINDSFSNVAQGVKSYAYINGEQMSVSKDYTELWNKVKNNSNFQKLLKDRILNQNITDPTSSVQYSNVMLAKATEWNNTYQTNDAPSNTKTTNGKEVNANRGLTQVTDKSDNINTRFIYTPDDVNTTSTYYYGPFDSQGNLFSSHFNNDLQSTALGRDIYNATNITKTTNTYSPVFISTNEEITKTKLSNSNTTSTNKTIGKYYWHNGYPTSSGNQTLNQWVSDYIIESAPYDCLSFLKKNTGKSEYIVDNYDFNPVSSSRTLQNESDNGLVYKDIYSNLTTDAKKKKHQEYKADYLTAYISSSMYTGIWYTTSYWYDATNNKVVGVYLVTQTGSQFNITGTDGSYLGLQTTQYTYYQLDDVLKLDGIRTKSIDDPTASDSTEIEIISAILTKLLSDNDCKKVIVQALAEYASNNNFSTNEYSSANYLAQALANTEFASNSIASVFSLQSKDTLNNINYNESTTETITLYKKFQNLTKGSTENLSDEQKLIMMGVSNKVIFKNILLATMTDFTSYNTGTGVTISNYDFTYFLYKYINYLKSKGVKDNEITNYLKSLNDNFDIDDFDILNALTSLDWNSYITMIGGDADASESGIGYNSSTDLKKLYEAFSSQGLLDGTTAVVKKGYALPISSASATFIGENGTKNTEVGNNLNKDVTTAITQEASSYNIGYYVGAELKAYKEMDVSYNKYYYPNNSTTSIDLDGSSNTTYPKPSDEIRKYLTDELYYSDDDKTKYGYTSNTYHNGDYLMRIASSKQVFNGINDENNLIYVPNGKVGADYTGPLLLPIQTIWVAPVKAGVFKFVIVNDSTEKCSFYVHKLKRSKPGVYSSYFESSEELISYNSLLLPNKSGATDGSGYVDGAYYFEIEIKPEDIKAGYEYAISAGDSSPSDSKKKPYVAYIDMGTSGSDTTTKQYPDLKTIEEKYNTYYIDHSLNSSSTKLSNFGLYLASNFISSNNKFTSGMTITVTKPTILLIKGKNGSVTVSGKTEYAPPDADGKPDSSAMAEKISTDSVKKSFSLTEEYRAYYLSGDESTTGVTYTLTATADCNVSEVLLVVCGSSVSKTSSTSEDIIKVNNGTSESTLYKGAQYEDLNSFSIDLFSSTSVTYRDKIIKSLLTLYSTWTSIEGTGTNQKTIYDFFNQENINFDYKTLVSLLAQVDYYDYKNSAFGKLLLELKEYSDDLLRSLDYEDIKISIMKEIVSIVYNDSEKTNTKNLVIAAYLGQDYLNNSKQLTKTKMSELLKSWNEEYQFIESDTTINPENFVNLINILGGNADIEGYGIFALASSKGIKNGSFIPDNLTLLDMDPNNEVEENNTEWRGGSTLSTSSEGTVNYAFYTSMKQLKKSISTSIIELDLEDSNIEDSNIIYFANSNQITKNNDGTGVIKYYVTQYQLNSMGNNLSIDTFIYANGATVKLINGSTQLPYDKNSSITIVDKIAQTKILVTAEDETVQTLYDIEFIVIDGDNDDKYVLTYDDSSKVKEISYDGGDVTLEFTTTNSNLANIDLSPYITISNGDKSYNYISDRNIFSKYFTFYTTGNYQVLQKTDSVDNNKNIYKAIIKLNISSSLPYGDYIIEVKIGTNESVKLSKKVSSEANIEYFEFDHESITFTNNKVTSLIQFGRVIYESECIVGDNGVPSYLNDLIISSNATISLGSYSISYENNLRVFTIIYIVTAENGTPNEYTHIIKEKAPFTGSYATVYKDGNDILANTTEVGITRINDDLLNANDKLKISYARNDGAPTFRIYFNLNNFAETGSYEVPESTDNDTVKTVVQDANDGFYVTIAERTVVGEYSFQYSYKDVLGRIFNFPIVQITKDYSISSTIDELTFISDNIDQSTSATRISPNYAFVVNENTNENQTKYNYDENEPCYDGFNNTTVTMNGKNVIYASKKASTNYFIYGSVSEVQLSDYSPTFKVDDYAEMYKYTTSVKLETASGSEPDTNILITNSGKFKESNYSVYLYVPFFVDKTGNGESSDDTYSTFLVQMNVDDLGNKYLTNVYLPTDVSKSIGTLLCNGETSTLSTIHDSSFSYGGIVYNVSQYSGEEGNVSLNMDYIGDPADGHFWYISYAVFSEAFIKGNDVDNANYYHITVIDRTNTIYFTIKVKTPIPNSSVYLTISYIVYDEDGNYTVNTLSCYATKPVEMTDELGNKYYELSLQYDLSMLPASFFRFNLELPNGYSAIYTTSKENKIEDKDKEKGSYYAPPSLVPQQVELTFEIIKSDSSSSSSWGVGTTLTSTIEATYDGYYDKSGNLYDKDGNLITSASN